MADTLTARVEARLGRHARTLDDLTPTETAEYWALGPEEREQVFASVIADKAAMGELARNVAWGWRHRSGPRFAGSAVRSTDDARTILERRSAAVTPVARSTRRRRRTGSAERWARIERVVGKLDDRQVVRATVTADGKRTTEHFNDGTTRTVSS